LENRRTTKQTFKVKEMGTEIGQPWEKDSAGKKGGVGKKGGDKGAGENGSLLVKKENLSRKKT